MTPVGGQDSATARSCLGVVLRPPEETANAREKRQEAGRVADACPSRLEAREIGEGTPRAARQGPEGLRGQASFEMEMTVGQKGELVICDW